MSDLVTPVVGSMLGETWKMPERVQHDSHVHDQRRPTTPRRSRSTCCSGRPSWATNSSAPTCCIAAGSRSTPRSTPTCRRSPSRRTQVLPEDAGRHRRTRSSRSTRRPARSARWSAGSGFQPRVNEINMALVPRQTGSSIKIFILAAALQAGVQPDRPARRAQPLHVRRPQRRNEAVPHQRCDGRGVATLQQHTWSSINCAYRPLVADHRPAPGRRHHVPHGALALPLPGPPDRAPVEPYGVVRHRCQSRCARSTWRRACRRSRTTACTTIRTTSTTSNAPTAPGCTRTRIPVYRCSIPVSRSPRSSV